MWLSLFMKTDHIPCPEWAFMENLSGLPDSVQWFLNRRTQAGSRKMSPRCTDTCPPLQSEKQIKLLIMRKKWVAGRRVTRRKEMDAVIARSPAESLPVISNSYKLPAGITTLWHLRHHTPHGYNLTPGKMLCFKELIGQTAYFGPPPPRFYGRGPCVESFSRPRLLCLK